MTKFDAFECFLVTSCLNRKHIANLNVIVEVAVNLDRPVYHFAYYLELLAEAFRAPGEGGRVTHVTLSHEIVQLVAIWLHYVVRVDKVGEILVGKL